MSFMEKKNYFTDDEFYKCFYYCILWKSQKTNTNFYCFLSLNARLQSGTNVNTTQYIELQKIAGST